MMDDGVKEMNVNVYAATEGEGGGTGKRTHARTYAHTHVRTES